MAKCEQGYLCDVCGQDVAELVDSDLYLRFVIGMVDAETLHTTSERHIRCNPSLAQYIVDPEFSLVVLDSTVSPFAKSVLDPEFVVARENLVTRGWQRLREIPRLGIAIVEYPLPEFRERSAERIGDE